MYVTINLIPKGGVTHDAYALFLSKTSYFGIIDFTKSRWLAGAFPEHKGWLPLFIELPLTAIPVNSDKAVGHEKGWEVGPCFRP
jgi:hypothetical protein